MGIGSAITSFFVSMGASATTAAALSAAVIQTGAGLIISAATNAIFGRGARQPKAQDLARELAQPTALPAYRHVYGRTRATGTPANTPVRGEHIWGVWILNSRPSELTNPVLYLDKREVRWWDGGDIFDLSGSGGVLARNDKFDDHVTAWIGRGDQTAPPKHFTDSVPFAEGGDEDLYKLTDAWRGRTVIWLKIKAGENEERQERWPSAPPLVEVEGEWSRVWDPRDETQDPDDPETWGYSDNHALCVLDALRQNPMRQYKPLNLHLPSFSEGADIADERVELRSGGTEARYRAAGTLTYDRGEVEDAVNPLVLSGAANLVRIGGKLGYSAGVWQEPTTTLKTMLGEGFEFSDMMPGAELVNELRVSYLSAERGYETAELQPWPIPGALAEDGGLPAPRDLELRFCPSPTQAMRVRKISGLRLRRQERIEGGQLPPEAFDLVPGSTATVAFPQPYDALDGTYEIEQIHPSLDPMGSDGVALRMPAALVKTGPDIYAWSSVEEEDVVTLAYNATRKSVQPPGPLSATADNLDTGETVIPRLRISFFPSSSGGVEAYEMQVAEAGTGSWSPKARIDAEVRDADGRVYGVTEALDSSKSYDVRVRTVAAAGASSYRTLTGIPPEGLDVTLTAPLAVTPFDTSVPGEIVAAFRTKNEPDTQAVEIWGSDTNSIAAASLLGEAIFTGANATVSITETGLGAGVTRYYFARSLGPFGSTSPFSAGASATTT